MAVSSLGVLYPDRAGEYSQLIFKIRMIYQYTGLTDGGNAGTKSTNIATGLASFLSIQEKNWGGWLAFVRIS